MLLWMQARSSDRGPITLHLQVCLPRLQWAKPCQPFPCLCVFLIFPAVAVLSAHLLEGTKLSKERKTQKSTLIIKEKVDKESPIAYLLT